jgi:tRNA threonylcarbamoyl adenosine modification protein (Sua5/YciO/YrdC/YwlC family)
MRLQVDPHDPEHWLLSQAVKVLQNDGVLALPTDTVYGVACDVRSEAGAERIYAMKGMDKKKMLSILCSDLGMAATYVTGIPNNWFRILKRELPGPYTFILPASKELPRVMLKQRKTVGIRVPDCPITQEIIRQLGRPLLTTSIRLAEGQWINDPEEIEAEYRGQLDLVVDGGLLLPEPSTVIDLSGRRPELIRMGKGQGAFLEDLSEE